MSNDTLRDLCAKFQSHIIYFSVRAFFELILLDYELESKIDLFFFSNLSKYLDGEETKNILFIADVARKQVSMQYNVFNTFDIAGI